MAGVRLEGIRKVFRNGAEFVAVHGADLEIADGELLVMVGPSGCGKSTILRMIAGLEPVSAGRLYIDDRLVNDVPPKQRDIAMVFQNYALYPHMSVHDNLAFGLKLRKMTKMEIEERVGEAAGILGLEPILDRKPRQLSGGQRQRVALGRALVRHPKVFLFDEPLSNLDAKLRVQMRTEIARLHRRLGATMIYVTHDQVEAMTLGERIVVLDGGRIQQVAAPLELYERPVNRFVAGFIGSPAMNFVSGEVEARGDLRFRAGGSAFELDLDGRPGLGAYGGRRVILGFRPEHVEIVGREEKESPGVIEFTLDVVEPMGNEVFIHARAGDHDVVVRVPPQDLPEPGTPLRLRFDTGRLHFFDAESGQAIGSPAPGASGRRHA
ncbi:MAG TPA: sn-glycerol-3-phosphate ABC transporter ATP-binding protein UgpC [Gemmatimonadota bacterium]|nr:sn-glycerol-3-phosphate ABC transporter ATP-binding protein UgpC [Gemmatimonadota bacterium]